MRTLLPSLCLVAALGGSVRADDLSRLEQWFSLPEATRGPVPTEVTTTLDSPAAVSVAASNLWGAYKAGCTVLGWDKELPPLPPPLEAIRAMPEADRPKAQPVMLQAGGKEMPMLLLAKGARGTNGWPLFLSLHGGGRSGVKVEPHGARMNTSEWQAQVRLFQAIYPPGLYLIPRMADDNDGRWWFGYCQAIFDRAIRCAILYRDADPNRVFIMGISEGGYAAYRLGAHMADRWAGSCALAAAEPLDTSPPENFRNVPFRCGIGEKDTMFDRIGLARRYFERLDELRAADGDPLAYIHLLDAQKDRGHGIEYQAGPDWMAQHTRNPWPRRVVWTVQPLHDVTRRQMYWLALDEASGKGQLFLVGLVEGNNIRLDIRQEDGNGGRKPATGLRMRCYLNDTLADLNQPVRVVVNGQTVHEGRLQRRLTTLARSLNERGDPYFCFPAEVEVKL